MLIALYIFKKHIIKLNSPLNQEIQCLVINVFPIEEGLNFNFSHFKDKIKVIKFLN